MKYILYPLILLFKTTRHKVFIVVYEDEKGILKYSIPMRWSVAKNYFNAFSDAIAIDFKLNIQNILTKNEIN